MGSCGAFCSFCGRCGKTVEKSFANPKPPDVAPPGVSARDAKREAEAQKTEGDVSRGNHHTSKEGLF